MGKHTNRMSLLAVSLCATMVLGACTKQKRVQFVLREDLSVVVPHHEPDATGNVPTVIGFPDVFADLLAENGYTRDDVAGVYVVSGQLGSANVQGGHDWSITGQVRARRMDGIVAGPTVDVVQYTDQSLWEAEQRRFAAPLTADGVALIKQAIDDYLAGDSPILEFEVNNDGVSPGPTVLDPMAFDLQAWLTLHVVIERTVEVPDPF